MAYFNGLCDDTCFKSASPISASFAEGWGFTHSSSRSCKAVSILPTARYCDASASEQGPGDSCAYLDVEVVVDSQGVNEEGQVLREVGELPHVP